jgi:D-alanine-D-alanine ligase
MSVAALYELFEIPYTGSSALTLGTALNKGLTKSLLIARAVPTAPHCVISEIGQLKSAPVPEFPLIVKPMCEDASIGIDSNAVVDGEVALRKQVRFVLNEFRQPAIVEQFIDGRELNVSLLAASPNDFQTLPISEILFDGLPEGAPRIVSYEAKWVQESEFYRATVASCPADLEPDVAARAREIALAAARTIGIRDYGRVDLRLRESDGALFVLEVNPNPDLNDDAGFLRAARVSGRTYESTVREILERALERHAIRRPRARRRAATR